MWYLQTGVLSVGVGYFSIFTPDLLVGGDVGNQSAELLTENNCREYIEPDIEVGDLTYSYLWLCVFEVSLITIWRFPVLVLKPWIMFQYKDSHHSHILIMCHAFNLWYVYCKVVFIRSDQLFSFSKNWGMKRQKTEFYEFHRLVPTNFCSKIAINPTIFIVKHVLFLEISFDNMVQGN